MGYELFLLVIVLGMEKMLSWKDLKWNDMLTLVSVVKNSGDKEHQCQLLWDNFITDIAEVVGTMNLCLVFYAMNMLDGKRLIAEIHQADPMTNVNVVVGKMEEAVTCVDMFNKNIAAYLM